MSREPSVPRSREARASSPAPRGRGYFDIVEPDGPGLVVAGWLFPIEGRVERYRVSVEGAPAVHSARYRRDDVVDSYGRFFPCDDAGFSARVPIAGSDLLDWRTIVVAGEGREGDVAVQSIRFKTGYASGLPLPPRGLRVRVVGYDDERSYWLQALKTFGEFAGALDRHSALGPRARLLDWGCGCGRVIGLMRRHLEGVVFAGCDIDAEAVEWCRRNLPDHDFAVLSPLPPSPFEPDSFDAVTGNSVLTHLERSVQAAWLREIRRILKPGGLLFASVNGPFAARFASAPEVEALRRDGIADAAPDAALDGIAPAGYYRSVYLTREYVTREFSRILEVVEYREQAMSNFQDLVVLRKP